MPVYFIGIHLGTRGLRAVVVDELGQFCAADERGYEMHASEPGFADQDPDSWTRAAGPAVAGALRRAIVAPSDVAAVGISAQRHSLIACSDHGVPLRAAMVWPDVRASGQAAALLADIPAQELARITGLNSDPMHMMPKLLWLREHEPDTFEESEIFTPPGPFLFHYITGEWAMDFSTASDTMLYDMTERAWSAHLLEIAHIEASRLPRLVSGTEVCGRVGREFSQISNLVPGTPVVAGGGFEMCAAIGSGVTGPGMCSDIIDMHEPVCTFAEGTAFDDSRLLETHDSPNGALRCLLNPGFPSGINYQWFRDRFSRLEIDRSKNTFRTAFDLMNDQAAEAPPGSGGVLFFPFLGGARAPEWNANARGMFTGLDLSHGREHMIRAVLEGAAYALRDNVETLESAGLPIKEIRVVGGLERNPITEEIRAHVTGKPVSRTNVPETGTYGAALLAAVGSGHFDTIAQAAGQWVRVVRVFEPDLNTTEIYNAMYRKYRLIHERLKGDYETLWGE